MAFADDLIFPERIARGGLNGKNRRKVLIGENQGGYEQRNLIWTRTRREFDAGMVTRTVSDWKLLEQFWEACDASHMGYRLRNPKDYQCPLSNGVLWSIDVDGNTIGTAGIGDGATLTFRLHMNVGTAAHSRYRDIRKPYGTIAIYKNVVAVGGGATLDMNTGIVTFSSAPAGSDVLTWSGNFHTPARFLNDDLGWSVVDVKQSGELLVKGPSVPIIEIRL